MAEDPISTVAAWLTPASADADDPVLSLLAELDRIEKLWEEEQGRADEIFDALPEAVREGRVRVAFSDHNPAYSFLDGWVTDEQQLRRRLSGWRRLAVEWWSQEESPEATAAKFAREIGLDQALTTLRAGQAQIKAIREASGCEAHYRAAADLAQQADEVRDQISRTKPISIAGAIDMLRLAIADGMNEDIITAVIAGLRDMHEAELGE